MPELGITLRVEGANQVTQSLREMEARARQMSTAMTGTMAPARQAVTALSSALASTATVLRFAGSEGQVLARHLDMATIALAATGAAVQTLRGLTLSWTAVMTAARVAAAALTVQAAAMWAALLGPFGAVLAGAVAVGLALGLLGEKMGFARQAAENLSQEMDESASKTASWVRAWSVQSSAFDLVRESAFGLQLQLRGLLGVQNELAAQWRVGVARITTEQETAARRQADAQSKLAEALREVRLERESAEAVRTIEGERAFALAEALRRQQEFVRESDRLNQDRVRLEEETAELIRLANQQAIERIEEEYRQRVEETRRALQEIATLEQETADLIRTANQQAIEAIEQEERDRLRLTRELLEEEKRLRDEARQSLENSARSISDSFRDAFADTFLRARDFGEALSNLFSNLAIRIFQRFWDVQILPSFFKIFGLAQGGIVRGGLTPILAAQSGGIVDRPTLAMIGEGGEREAIIPERFWPALRSRGDDRGRAQEIVVTNYVVFDRSQIPTPTPEEIQSVVVADIRKGGPIGQAIRRMVR